MTITYLGARVSYLGKYYDDVRGQYPLKGKKHPMFYERWVFWGLLVKPELNHEMNDRRDIATTLDQMEN